MRLLPSGKRDDQSQVESCIAFEISRKSTFGFKARRSCSLQSGAAPLLHLEWYSILHLVSFHSALQVLTSVKKETRTLSDLSDYLPYGIMPFSQTIPSMCLSSLYFALSNAALVSIGAFK